MARGDLAIGHELEDPAAEEGGDEAAHGARAPDDRLEVGGKLLRLALAALDHHGLGDDVGDGDGGRADEHAREAGPDAVYGAPHEHPAQAAEQAGEENVGLAPVAENGEGVGHESVQGLASPRQTCQRRHRCQRGGVHLQGIFVKVAYGKPRHSAETFEKQNPGRRYVKYHTRACSTSYTAPRCRHRFIIIGEYRSVCSQQGC